MFCILSASFYFCRIYNNRIFSQDKQSQNSQHRALKNTVKKMFVLQFYSLDFSLLDVDCLDFAYPAKNPVNADFTGAKRNRQDAKNKCCIMLFIGIRCTVNCPESFLRCFKLCELGVIPGLLNTIPDTYDT